MTYRVIFFGTAPFAVPLLEALIHEPRFGVVGVVTQPDRPTGRKATLTAPATKLAAVAEGVPVFQFETVKDTEAIQTLRELNPDILMVASFGQIIPLELLKIAKLGALNFHWSLLPRYRGASPVQAAILNGDAITGATIMLMDTKMDHGPILAQFEEAFLPADTALELYWRLSLRGAPILVETIFTYLEGQLTPRLQVHEQATFVKLLTRDDGRLDPRTHTAETMERMLRAYQPWPGTYFQFEKANLKILAAYIGVDTTLAPGTGFIRDNLPAIACAAGTSLVLTKLQPSGKTIMDGRAFLRGRPAWQGCLFSPS